MRGSGDRSSTGFGTQYSSTPDGNLYLNGTSVVDSQDRAVYIEEAADPATDPQTYKYTRARANPVKRYTSTAPQRYAYNDERIKITATDVAEIEMDYRGRSYALTDILPTGTDGSTAATGYILSERDKNLGIPSSITLRI